MQLLLQFYNVLFETLHALMSWRPECMNVLMINSKIKFFFRLANLVILTYSFHDISYLIRQTLSGEGHNFSEFACFLWRTYSVFCTI